MIDMEADASRMSVCQDVHHNDSMVSGVWGLYQVRISM
jgi:hypothetical protein